MPNKTRGVGLFTAENIVGSTESNSYRSWTTS